MEPVKYPLFGEHVKWQREFHKITQAEIAKKLGVDTHTVSNWECGLYLPPRNKIRELSKCLSMYESELMELRERAAYQKQYDRLEQQGTLIPFKLTGFNSSSAPPKHIAVTSPLRHIVVLDSHAKLEPAEILKNHQSWNGARFKFAPPSDRYFGFKISDRSMEPKFAPGDLLLVDIQRMNRNGTVVLKLKGLRPMCRISTRNGRNVVLRALNPKEQIRVVKKQDLEWSFSVVSYFSESV